MFSRLGPAFDLRVDVVSSEVRGEVELVHGAELAESAAHDSRMAGGHVSVPLLPPHEGKRAAGNAAFCRLRDWQIVALEHVAVALFLALEVLSAFQTTKNEEEFKSER